MQVFIIHFASLLSCESTKKNPSPILGKRLEEADSVIFMNLAC